MSINAVYYPSWRVYKGFPPSALQIDKISHVFYAFARVNEDGTLRSLDPLADFEKPVDNATGCIQALTQLRSQSPNLKVILSIGGGSGSSEFPTLASDHKSRSNFANSARQWVDQHSFDGIDIDWEHPHTAAQGADYLALLQAARAVLPSPRYLLTTALPVGEYTLKHINLSAAAEVLDYLNLMTYDFAGPWTERAGHHAQLVTSSWARHNTASIQGGIKYIQKHSSFPVNKILLGIPAYARYFPGAKKPGDRFDNTTAGEVEYRSLPPGWITYAVVDKTKATAHVVDEEGGKGFISFDVPATVKVKAEWATQQGLAGVFYWTGVADTNDDRSLVRAGFDALHSAAVNASSSDSKIDVFE